MCVLFQECYSINYHHYGAPKTWYTIPFKHNRLFEAFLKEKYAKQYKMCENYVKHKEFHVHPDILRENGIGCEVVSIYCKFVFIYYFDFNWNFLSIL